SPLPASGRGEQEGAMLPRYFATPGLLAALAAVPVLGGLALVAHLRRRRLLARLGPPGVIAAPTDPGARPPSPLWTLPLILLGRAKEALAAFAAAVQARGGHRLALVAFAGRAAVVCPLTHDYDHFRTALAALNADPPPPSVRSAGDSVSGTRLGAGLRAAVAL